VVTGIERDDAPLLEALAATTEALFVVLRSANLPGDRMREIKAAFAKHRRPAQRLVALRLDATAEVAVERIATQIQGGLRSRSETSLTLAIEEVTPRLPQPSGPHPVIAASRAARAASAVHAPGSRRPAARPVAPVAPPPPRVDVEIEVDLEAEAEAAPSVPTALSWATQANERATTARYSIDDETLPLPLVDASPRPRKRPSSTRTPILFAGAALAIASAVGIAYWLLEATAPGGTDAEAVLDSTGRVSLPTPADTSAPRERDDTASASSRTPAIAAERDDEAPRAPSRRPRARRPAPTTMDELPTPPPAPTPTIAAEAPPPPEPEPAAIPSEPAPLEGEPPPATP